MDQKLKSIWKKSLKFPGLLMAWLILVVVTMLVFSIVILLMGDIFSKTSDFVGLLIFGAVVATILLCLWIFILWIFCRRNFKRFLFGLACLATLDGLFYAEENWRGKRDWENYKHDLEARGEKLDYDAFIPPAVPDDDNFAFSPVWIAEIKFLFQNNAARAKSWYGDLINEPTVAKILPLMPVSDSAIVGTNVWSFSQPPQSSGTWAAAKFFDLKPFQKFYRDTGASNPAAQIIIAPQPQTPALDVLLALSKFDPVIEQLRKDSARQYSRFPVRYDDEDPAGILLPHLAALRRTAQVLQLRAIAELQNGETEKAFADVKLSLRLVDAVQTEPFNITHLVRIAILDLTLQPVYEGLAEHKWSDAQMTELDAEFSKINFLDDYERSTRSERAAHIKMVDWIQEKRSRFSELLDMLTNEEKKDAGHFWLKAFRTLGFYPIPRGWFYQSEIALSDAQEKWMFPIVNDAQQTVSPQLARKSQAAVSALPDTPRNFFARLLIPEIGPYAQRVAKGQTEANEARTAIALERYRLAHGEFPESLDALAPQFMEKIPHDVIGGQPLHYRRTDDGQFILYSVGWNETDDGGVMIFKKGSPPEVDTDKGDWVWRYPQK